MPPPVPLSSSQSCLSCPTSPPPSSHLPCGTVTFARIFLNLRVVPQRERRVLCRSGRPALGPLPRCQRGPAARAQNDRTPKMISERPPSEVYHADTPRGVHRIPEVLSEHHVAATTSHEPAPTGIVRMPAILHACSSWAHAEIHGHASRMAFGPSRHRACAAVHRSGIRRKLWLAFVLPECGSSPQPGVQALNNM